MAPKPLPSREVLRQSLDYDAKTGKLSWRQRPDMADRWNTRWAGKPAFTTIGPSGYFFGQINGEHYQAHRVIWKWWHGAEPVWIDHIDGNKLNNRIANIRSVTREVNAQNLPRPRTNSSGEMNVHKCPTTGRWRVQFAANHEVHRVGRFDTIEEAVAARNAAMAKHGFHPNHGRKE